MICTFSLAPSVDHISCLLLPPFHNVSHSSIFPIYIGVNESRHIYLSRFININMNVGNAIMIGVNESRHIYLFRFININMNVGNARMTYIVKRRK